MSEQKRPYETTFVLMPTLSGEQLGGLKSEVLAFLKKKKATVVEEEDWGLRKLAYPIRQKNTGFYHLVRFKAQPQVLSDLEVFYRRNSSFMRFLTVSMDKHAVDYHARRKKKRQEEQKLEQEAQQQEQQNEQQEETQKEQPPQQTESP